MAHVCEHSRSRSRGAALWVLLPVLGLCGILQAEDPAPPCAPAAIASAKPASTLTWTDLTDQLTIIRHGLGMATIAPDGEALCIGVPDQGNPESVRIALTCSSTKKATKEIDVVPRYPGITDGSWHEVAIPFDDMTVGTEFDPKKAWEINILTGAKAPVDEDTYLD